jgi:hypothetical protein
MAVMIYVLCASTALVCAVLLLLGSRRAGSRMLFWSGLCFAGLAFTNLVVVVDALDLFPYENFSTLRLGSALVALSLLLYGLVFEEK